MPITPINRNKTSGTSMSNAHNKDAIDKIDETIVQINTNETDISTNTGNIAISTGDISKNKTDLSFGINGFNNPSSNPDTDIDFIDATRTFTIVPTGVSATYWSDSLEYTFTTIQSVVIDDVEADHYIYFDGATLKSSSVFFPSIIDKYAIVSIVLWDKVHGINVGWAEERHGKIMSGKTHLSLHLNPGTIFVHGCDLGYSTSSTAPTDDTTSKVFIDEGVIKDEDIGIVSINSATPSDRWEQILGSDLTTDAGKFPVISLDGADGNWRKWPNDSDRFAFEHNGGNTPPYYNEFTGGAWQKSVCTNRDYVVYYICMWNDYHFPVFSIMGQGLYDRIGDARATTATNLSWGAYDPAEIIVLHKLIFEYRTTYTNATHRCVLREVESYNILGTSKVAIINANTNHASLQNLDYDASGHIGFTHTMYISTSDPTTDNDEIDTADIGRTFSTGEFWYNSSGTKFFVCVDSTATSAVWKQITLL